MIDKKGWEKKKLGEIAFITMGQSPSSESYNETKGLPFFQGNADFGKLYPKVRIYCTEPTKLAKPDDILISVRAPIGAVNISNSDCCIGRGLASVRAIENTTISKYLYYLLISANEKLNRLGTGSTFKAINKDSLFKLESKEYPIPIQQQIVSELDTLSDIISKKKQQLADLDTLAQATFYDMFGDPVSNEKGWEMKMLNDVCDVRDGTHDSPKYVQEGYPLITSKNLSTGTISFENVNLINQVDFDNINKRSNVDDGDILMPMIGTIGNPIIVKKDRDFCIKNVALIKFTKTNLVLNTFVNKVMRNESFIEKMMSVNKGGIQKFISLGMIRKLTIPIPPIQIQNQFSERIESIEEQKFLINKSIADVQHLFDYTMDRYFN